MCVQVPDTQMGNIQSFDDIIYEFRNLYRKPTDIEIDQIKRLCRDHPEFITKTDKYQHQTLLEVAIINNYFDLALFLSENGAELNGKILELTLHCMVNRLGQKSFNDSIFFVKYLISKGVDINEKIDGISIFNRFVGRRCDRWITTCKDILLKFIQNLIDLGADLTDTLLYVHNSVLVNFIMNQNVPNRNYPVYRYIIENKIDLLDISLKSVNVNDKLIGMKNASSNYHCNLPKINDGINYLMLACFMHKEEMRVSYMVIDILLRAGANINATDAEGNDVFHYCTKDMADHIRNF